MYDSEQKIEVIYPSGKIVYDELTTKQLTSPEPKIIFEKDPSKLYTIMIIDPDAPSRLNPINKYHLHYLLVNSNQVINTYQGPNPPVNSGPHRYYVCVFEQKSRIENVKEFPRSKFNFLKFVSDNSLILTSYFKFRVEVKG